jgi:hypothetical protein
MATASKPVKPWDQSKLVAYKQYCKELGGGGNDKVRISWVSLTTEYLLMVQMGPTITSLWAHSFITFRTLTDGSVCVLLLVYYI